MSSQAVAYAPDQAFKVSRADSDLGVYSELADDVREGLMSNPKHLPSKYFYDERGSRLFERITELPEYYPMRAEREILTSEATRIIESCRPRQLVELGPGSSTKTRALLDAMEDAALLESYVPVEISESIVHQSAVQLSREYPGLSIHALIGDFERDMYLLPDGEDRLIAFLGGTFGNFFPEQRRGFLVGLRKLMGPGDFLLLGTDLVKPLELIEAAYNDDQGVTADFNKNILRVLNRQLEGNFNIERFEHVAFFDEPNSWIEMRLRCLDDHSVRIGSLDMSVPFEAGEEVRTEISCKFTMEEVASLYGEAGFDIRGWFTDKSGRFALSTASVTR